MIADNYCQPKLLIMEKGIDHGYLLKQWLSYQSTVGGDRYTQKRLSIESGISAPSISMIVAGHTKNPDISTLERIASAFGVTVSEYLEGPPAIKRPKHIKPVYDLDGKHIDDLDMSPIPVLTHIRCADGIYFEDSYPPGHASEYIPRYGVKGEHVFAVKVTGDSMEPDLEDGDHLTVDPDQEFYRFKGGIGVVCLPDDRTIIRRIYRRNGEIALVPANPDYAPEMVRADQVEIFKVVKYIPGYKKLDRMF